MKELKNWKTRTFESGKWIIDIVEKRDSFDAWLSIKNHGEKAYMFGSAKEQQELGGTPYTVDFDMFCELVEANLPEYKRIFLLEHKADD